MNQRLTAMVRVMLAVLVAVVAVWLSSRSTAAAQPPVAAVSAVDLDRYIGDWYEVARYPNRFQRQCAGDVRVTYAQQPDGRVDVTNRCRRSTGAVDEAQGVALVVDDSAGARLKVRFAPAWLGWLPVVWGDYWIIGLDPDDYRWAVVGTPDRDYLWVLSRTPTMDDSTYAAAIDVVRSQGFDPARLQRTTNRSTQ